MLRSTIAPCCGSEIRMPAAGAQLGAWPSFETAAPAWLNWQTVAIGALAALLVWRFAFSTSAKRRRAELGRARQDYRRRLTKIYQQYGRV